MNASGLGLAHNSNDHVGIIADVLIRGRVHVGLKFPDCVGQIWSADTHQPCMRSNDAPKLLSVHLGDLHLFSLPLFSRQVDGSNSVDQARKCDVDPILILDDVSAAVLEDILLHLAELIHIAYLLHPLLHLGSSGPQQIIHVDNR